MKKKKETISWRRNGVLARTEMLGNGENHGGETQLVSIPDPFHLRSLCDGGLALLARRQGVQQAVLHRAMRLGLPPCIYAAISSSESGTAALAFHGQEANANVAVEQWIPSAIGSIAVCLAT
jgi:hypothetical protein